MTETLRVCSDCRHFKAASPLLYWGRERLTYAKCHAPRQISGDGLVHLALERGSFCSLNRRDADKCGPQANWYEPRD